VSAVSDIADGYVERSAALDPAMATAAGIAGYDAELTDWSPVGIDARADLERQTLTALDRAPVEDDRDRITADVLRERLLVSLDAHAADEDLRALRPIGSPVDAARMVFDLMSRETEDDWATIRARLDQVPRALAGFTESLRLGLDRGKPAARRQALACAAQARAWSEGFFASFPASYHGPASGALTDAAARAASAYRELASFLTHEYAPAASEVDGVGPERYKTWARGSLGETIDIGDTYRWGIEELARIEGEMAVAAGRVVPGATIREAFDYLESEPRWASRARSRSASGCRR
jgi:uncharacterized protein (DUF885 family)